MHTPRTPRRHPVRQSQRQRGVVLVVSLILLVLMTLVGISALRTVTQEERMASHAFDRSLSFQAAEAALREAETRVDATRPSPAAGCADGVCAAPAPADTPRWLDTGFAGWKDAVAVPNGPITLTPQYVVEYLGNTFECDPGSPGTSTDCRRYRITARSNAGADRAEVMLQSVYATD